MFWLILLIVVAALCAPVLFLVAPAAGRKELRTPFAGRNFAHRGYFGKDQRPPENSLPARRTAAVTVPARQTAQRASAPACRRPGLVTVNKNINAAPSKTLQCFYATI